MAISPIFEFLMIVENSIKESLVKKFEIKLRALCENAKLGGNTTESLLETCLYFI